MREAGEPKPVPAAAGGGAGTLFFVLVFGFGAAAGVLAAFVGAGLIEESGGLIITVFLTALIVVGLVGGLIVAFRRTILRRLFGVAETQVEMFADPLSRVAEGALARDAGAATQAARDLVALALARYSWIATRRWIITSLTALIAAMAALAGTALLFKQNALIEAQTGLLAQQNTLLTSQTDLLAQQNDKIEAQGALLAQDVELAEAARNAALAVEITGIAAAVGAAAERSAMEFADGIAASGGAQDPVDALVNVIDPMTGLDRALMLRIVSASQAAKPYRFLATGIEPADDRDAMRLAMERRRADLPNTYARLAAANGWQDPALGATLIDRPASPERGQLLRVLRSGGLRNLEVLNFFGLDLSFAYAPYADIHLVTVGGGRLNFADFTGASVVQSDFGGAFLMNARFDRAIITGTTFARLEAGRVRTPFRASDAPFPSLLSGSTFTGAQLTDVSFAGAMMLAAGFDGALLLRADFRGTVLGAATFRGAVLIGADFTGADLKSADFDGAVVFGADFLDRLAAGVAEGRYRADLFRLEPMTVEEVMSHPAVDAAFYPEDLAAATGGAPAFRVVRTGPFTD